MLSGVSTYGYMVVAGRVTTTLNVGNAAQILPGQTYPTTGVPEQATGPLFVTGTGKTHL